jgi:gas vesicle protein
MNAGSFIKGMGAGMAVGAVGAAAAFTMMPKKKKAAKSAVGKALRSAGEVMDGISEALGR